MSDYSQPDFYRFNQDSLLLVKWIVQKKVRARNILDIGAGSGIIGIELANALLPDALTLLELQADYNPFLHQNVSAHKKGEYDSEIVINSLGNWKSSKKFDLIVSNPPYFLPCHGEPSNDLRRNLARTFLVDGWKILFERINDLLTDEGNAFLVIKNNKVILDHVKNQCVREIKLSEFIEKDLVLLHLTRLDKN